MAVTSASKPLASKVEPQTPHVSDSSIEPFLQPDFDPADYLNITLPALSTSTTARTGRAVPLADLSSQLQALLSQLNAQTSRLSNTLTQLTDEIIRSGSRLAYEVEVLRGETVGLNDTFENDLKKDIEVLASRSAHPRSPARDTPADAATNGGEISSTEPFDGVVTAEPDFLDRLRTLTTVRARLDAVIKTFGSAMQWPVAPSELSLTSSLISVSAPESGDDSRSREEKGKEFADSLRSEFNSLLSSGAEGVQAASARVEELRTLAEVWKGTAEEKARLKLVDSLQKLVDNKEKGLGRPSGQTGSRSGVMPARGYDMRYGSANSSQLTSDGGSGYGFLNNLRNQMYVD